MECPNCKAIIEDGDKFCGNCGAAITTEIVCKNCGTVNSTDSKFCENCGKLLTVSDGPKERIPINHGGADMEHIEKAVMSMDSDPVIRVEYINPFIESAFYVLEEVTGAKVKRGELYLKSFYVFTKGIAAWVGLAGDVEGMVLFDMDEDSALMIVSCMNGEQFTVMDDMAKATIVELANMITAQAVPKFDYLGFKLDLTPSGLFTGDSMEVSSNMEVEIAVVPMHVVLGNKKSKIEINVLIQKRN